MTFTGRITIFVATVACGIIGLASTALADALPAGNYQITSVFAQALAFNSGPPFGEGNLFVTDTITFSKSGGGSGGTNIVSVDASWSGAGSGCSILANSSDFTFSSDLSTASLHTTFTPDLQPCNEFQPLVPDMTVDATWSGPAASLSGKGTTRYACGGYRSEGLATNSNSVADALFSFSVPTPASESFEDNAATMALNDQSLHVQGTLPGGCIIGSKGFGIGPQPPGRYTFSSTDAAFSSTDGSVNFSVSNSTFASNPNGPASDRSGETRLFINLNGSFGCFILSPRDVSISSDLSGASLHTSLDENTQQCGSDFFPYLPLSIDMTLAATGPVATTTTNSPSGCFAIFFTDRITNAGGSATLQYPDHSVVTYPAAPSSGIDSFDHTFRMSGSTPCTQ